MKRFLFASSLLWSALSRAVVVPIVNHSFEADYTAPYTFRVLVPNGWALWDPNGIVDQSYDAVGILNPVDSTFFPNGAPDGDNVALVYLERDIGLGEVGLRQVLTTNLRPFTQYVLRVEVGKIASGFGTFPYNYFFNLDGFPGYRVELRAGGQVLAQDDNSLFGQIPEGQFRLSTVYFKVGATHPRMGQPLEVRVINLNHRDQPDPGIEVDFDNVRLDAYTLRRIAGH